MTTLHESQPAPITFTDAAQMHEAASTRLARHVQSLREQLPTCRKAYMTYQVQANELIVGGRRLAAAIHLGWKTIPVNIARNLDDIEKALKAERDEPSKKIAHRLSSRADEGARRRGDRITDELYEIMHEPVDSGPDRKSGFANVVFVVMGLLGAAAMVVGLLCYACERAR